MGMCPEEMERWGSVSIFKESARLLHKHYRLFLPFFLAFYLPGPIAGVFETLFLSPSSPPLPFGSNGTVQGSVNTAQTSDTPGSPSFTTIFSWTLFILICVVETLGAGAVSYITAYLYTPTDADDADRSIVPKVFKLLPHAFLRMFVTQIWMTLPLIFICAVVLIFVLVSAAANWSDLTSLLLLFVLLLFLAATVYLAIVFALAQAVAVLEPGNYGRKALKRSAKLARIGREWTIVAVTLTLSSLLLASSLSTNRILSWGMPVWAEVVFGIAIGGPVNAVFRLYCGVAMVVMYFAYKARFDAAAGSAGIPMFKRIHSAEHSYEPIVTTEKGSITFIGEP